MLVYTAILVLIVRRAGHQPGAAHARSRSTWCATAASLARLVDDGQIENVYRLQVMNATEQPQRYRVAVKGLPGIALDGADTRRGAARRRRAGCRWRCACRRRRPQPAGAGAHPIEFEIERLSQEPDAAPARAVEKSTFVVPR